MQKEKLRKLFVDVLESYKEAELWRLSERSTNDNDFEELEKDVAEWKNEFDLLLGNE